MGKSKDVKKKSLEKMTATELRQEAQDIPSIVGAHGMNKVELIASIKEARGIHDEKVKKSNRSIRQAKKKIKELKFKREKLIEEGDEKMAAIYRKRIIRLKKRTRRAA